MIRKNLRTQKGLRENPFHVQLLEEFKVKKKMEFITADRGAQHLIVDNDGEVQGESRFFKLKEYDDEKFTKVFTNRMTNMWDMIPTATRVYSYILSNMPINSSEMYFHFEEIQEFCKYKSSTSIWKGIKWLVENDFIAKSYKSNYYWLNPTLFFNGNRVAFVDIIVKKDTLKKGKSKLPPSEK